MAEREAAATLAMKATSTFDAAKHGEAAVPATGVAIAISSEWPGVAKGGSRRFAATVNGANGANGGAAATVRWSVTGHESGGTSVSGDGLLTVAADETAATLTIRATTDADTGEISGSTSVAVTPPAAFVGDNAYASLEEAVSAAAGATATITLMKSVNVYSSIRVGDANTHITLRGDGAPRTIKSRGSRVFGLMGNDVSLTLDNNIELDGAGVLVGPGGALTLKTGAKIANASSGAVYVTGLIKTFSGTGTFIMEGGSIEYNSSGEGGGVYVGGRGGTGIFVMRGGRVKNNRADGYIRGGGGVYVGESGAFVMEGGSIEGNTSGGHGGGVYVGNGGSFTMKGGSIEGNAVVGCDDSGDRLTTGYGYGGGVYVGYFGTFIMENGSIEGNAALGHVSGYNYGGGYGGGVYLADGALAFAMRGGSIKNNRADGYGGGAYIVNGKFPSGGSIWRGTFVMEGGSIKNNIAGCGGGVCLASGRFIMSGEAAIDAGNPVYLGRNAYISLSGSLAANPAANINCPPDAEWCLGGDRDIGDITINNNYKKFWLNDASNENGDKIDIYGRIVKRP